MNNFIQQQIFIEDSNSYAPGLNFFEFLVLAQAIIANSESAKHVYKSRTVLIWLLIIIRLKYNTNLKIYNTKVNDSVFEIIFLL